MGRLEGRCLRREEGLDSGGAALLGGWVLAGGGWRPSPWRPGAWRWAVEHWILEVAPGVAEWGNGTLGGLEWSTGGLDSRAWLRGLYGLWACVGSVGLEIWSLGGLVVQQLVSSSRVGSVRLGFTNELGSRLELGLFV